MSERHPSLAADRTLQRLISLVDELRSLPYEIEWVEFKRNNSAIGMVSERVSAISNAARLHDRDRGYILWGIDDTTHDVVGTDFDPNSDVGSQPYKFRLLQRLTPAPAFSFEACQHPGGRVVILEIPAANELPVSCGGVARIRVGSATPPLHMYPEIEKNY
jgi:ATP-dependent DNA helicase RecG